MKTLMITACLLLIALASGQRGSTTPKYIIPYGGPNININDPNINLNHPNININDPNVNINDPNLAQPANGVGGLLSSYDNANFGGGASFIATGTQVPAAAGGGGLSNSAENGGGLSHTQDHQVDDVADGSDAGGSVLNLDGTDGDSDASVKQGVNATALGVVLTIIIVLGIFGVVALVLIRQRRQNAADQ